MPAWTVSYTHLDVYKRQVFTYAAFGMRRFAFYLAGICAAFFGAAVLTYIVGFEEVEE